MKRILTALALALLAGCGTTYTIPPTLGHSARLSARSTPVVFNFPDFSPAAGSKLTASATYGGISAKGNAVVSRFDGSNIDLMLHVKKLVLTADVHVLLEAKADGVHFQLKQVGGNAPSNGANEQSGILEVKSVERNKSVFDYDGQNVTAAITKIGGKSALVLTLGKDSITVQ